MGSDLSEELKYAISVIPSELRENVSTPEKVALHLRWKEIGRQATPNYKGDIDATPFGLSEIYDLLEKV